MTPEAAERRRVREPVVALTTLAWAVLVFVDPPWSTAQHASGHVGAVHHASVGSGATPGASTDGAIGPGVDTVVIWMLMVTAMMAPLLIPGLRHVRARSLRRRRARAVGLVTVAAGATWAVGSLVLFGAAQAVASLTGDAGLSLLLALLVALCWQLTPLKQLCLNRHCAHPPIASFGWRADWDVLRFGVAHAWWCLGSCWALMLVALLAPVGALVVMLVVSVWMWVEPLDRPEPPRWRLHLPRRALRVAVVRWGR